MNTEELKHREEAELLNKFIESLQERFKDSLSNSEHILKERYEIIKKIPNAISEIEAAYLFYAAETKAKDFILDAKKTFLTTITDEEISMVYKELLEESLVNASQSFSNISEHEDNYLRSEATLAVEHTYPTFIDHFKNNRNNYAPFSKHFHDDMVQAVLQQLAKSTLFRSCDLDIYDALDIEISKQLDVVHYFMSDNIFTTVENNYKISKNLEREKMINIYNIIRKENSISEEILPEKWNTLENNFDAPLEIIIIQKITPKDIQDELMISFNEGYNKDTLSSTYTNVFLKNFKNALQTHADIVLVSHQNMNIEDRASLCKENTKAKLNYYKNLRKVSFQFTETQFDKIIKSRHTLNEQYTKVMTILETQRKTVRYDFCEKIEMELSKSFNWPKERAMAHAPTSRKKHKLG